ncbi:hypothetical protein CHS0354_000838 [Potamilus streckersoni]|uniref:URB1 ribosome biogenesis homolog n=1 Tax=Potamilus streckersoni TaxID=2493646 RepID=A0AAE0VK92_9BIVA|nr:hypothetical protein CHS0354_000838 [Potamilus streckersoni]
MKTIYFCLSMSNKSSQIKAALELLTAMIMLGPSSARTVVLQFDFKCSKLGPLFSRRDMKDSQDVRSCLIHFIVAFLLVGDNDVIRHLVDQKEFLSSLFKGIIFDRVPVIQLLLSSMLEKIVRNPGISKTAKVRLFSETALKQMGQLYVWSGPSRWKENTKDVSKVQDLSQEEDLMENPERAEVASAVHSFFKELCCSFKHGIIFQDRSFGTSGRNQNQIITSFLAYLSSLSKHSQVQELLTSILKACPELIHHFLPSMLNSLSPRATRNWYNSLEFIQKIYTSQLLTPPLLKSKEHFSLNKVVTILLRFTMPSSQVLNTVIPGIKNNNMRVRHEVLTFLKLLLLRAIKVLNLIGHPTDEPFYKVYTADDMKEIKESYTESVIKLLPDGQEIMQCWDKRLAPSQNIPSPSKADGQQELEPVDPRQHIVLIEQILCLYQEIVPFLMVNNPDWVGRLLEGIGTVSDENIPNENSRDDYMLPQLYLLKLLAGTDARRLPWGKEGHKGGNSLMFLLLDMGVKLRKNERVKQITTHLTCKMLKTTGFFESATEELKIWLNLLHKHADCSESRTLLVTFVSKVFMTFLSNPLPYFDKVSELASDAVTMETTDDDMETASVGTSEDAINAILEMDMEELEDENFNINVHSEVTESNIVNRLPFSPLFVVALDALKKDDAKSQDILNYISEVTLALFHQQTNPLPMCHLVKTCQSELPQHVCSFITSFISKNKAVKIKKLEGFVSKFQYQLMALHADKKMSTDQTLIKALKEECSASNPENSSVAAKSVMLYMSTILDHQQVLSKAREERLSLLFTLLREIIDGVNKNVNQPTRNHQEDKEDNEFSLLALLVESQGSILESHLQVILDHPSIKKWFLSHMSDENMKNKPGLAEITTSYISEYLCLACTLSAEELKPVLQFYRNKVFSCFKSFKDDMGTILGETVTVLFGCLLHLSKNIEVDQTIHVLKECLSLPLRYFSSSENQVGLKLLCQLLSDLVNSAVQRVIRITPEKVDKLIRIALNSKEETLLKSITDLLLHQAHLAFGCSSKILQELLKQPSKAVIRIADILISQSCLLMRTFEEFISSTKALQFVESYLPLFSTYCRIAASQVRSEGSCRPHLEKIGNIFRDDFIVICNTTEREFNSDLIHLLGHVIRLGIMDPKFISKLQNVLIKTVSAGTGVLPHHIQLLSQILHPHRESLSELRQSSDTSSGSLSGNIKSHDLSLRRQLLKACSECLVHTLASKSSRQPAVEDKIMDILHQFSEEELKDFITADMDFWSASWPKLVTCSLKHLYVEPRMLTFLRLVSRIICSNQSELSITMTTVFEMIFSHSLFLPVMLNEQHSEAKESLIDFLQFLAEKVPEKCVSSHIGIFLGAYGATLSAVDQKLLKLLFIYESYHVNMTEYKPFLWGEKAIEHHMVKRTLGPSLWKQPTMEQVLETLQPDVMKKTILKFPLRRKLQVLDVEDAKSFQSETDCYDPNFLMPLFSQLLSPDSLVDCQKFIELHCLSLCFAAISSHDKTMRYAAYHVLASYQHHLEGAHFSGKHQVLYFMNFVKNSVAVPGTKLACIITQFLARAVKLMISPEDHMYSLINSFLLLKPSLDVLNVPEFYKLFNSFNLEYKLERNWMLSLLVDGMRETSDYRIFEKRYIFKLLQSFHDSAMSDLQTKLKVLHIIHSACGQRTVASDFCHKHGLLTWLAGVIHNISPAQVETLSILIETLHSLWFTLLGDKGTSQNTELESSHYVSPITSSQVLFILQRLACKLGLMTRTIFQLYLTTLHSVLGHLKYTVSILGARGQMMSLPSLTLKDAFILLHQSSMFIPSSHADKFRYVLDAMGFNSEKLSEPKLKSTKQKQLAHVLEENKDRKEISDMEEVPPLKDEATKDGSQEENLKDLNKDFDVVKLLLKIIAYLEPDHAYFSELDVTGVEVKTSGVMVLTLWILEHLLTPCNTDLEILSSSIQWIFQNVTVKTAYQPLFLQFISEDRASSELIIGYLITLCAKVLKMRSEVDVMAVEPYCSESLNHISAILGKIAETRSGNTNFQYPWSEDETKVVSSEKKALLLCQLHLGHPQPTDFLKTRIKSYGEKTDSKSPILSNLTENIRRSKAKNSPKNKSPRQKDNTESLNIQLGNQLDKSKDDISSPMRKPQRQKHITINMKKE